MSKQQEEELDIIDILDIEDDVSETLEMRDILKVQKEKDYIMGERVSAVENKVVEIDGEIDEIETSIEALSSEIKRVENTKPKIVKGVDGKDGRDGVDGEDGQDGKDGENGKDGKDGSSDTAREILEKLSSLPTDNDDDKLDASHIKNRPEFHTGRGSRYAINGVPQGGTAGQVLAKKTNGDYDTEWVDGSGRGLTGNAGTNPSTDFIGTTDAQPLVVRTNNIERVRVLADGKVAIGRATPTHKLDVWGSSATDGITTNIGLNLSTVPAPVLGGGFTLTPTTGTALQIGQYYYRVTFYSTIGETTASNAVSVTTTAGNQVVSIAGIPISTDPTVIGRKIYRNKVGEGSSYGSVVGTLANNVATTFVDSLPDASIPGALSERLIYDKLDTTNRFITLNNTRAMFLHSSLTAFGLEAGNSITTGGANVLVGYRAGRLINSGSNNTIIGYTAGNSLTTAIDNTLIGMSAGLSLTTGSYNTVLTRSSLQGVTTGSFNITAGYFTGSQLTTSASNNVLLGGHIMSSGSWTTASNNVGIGHNATPLTIGGSNQLNLHNLVFGEGSGQANRRVFVRAGTTQTSNIFEVQNNAGAALTYVSNVGDLRTPRVYSAVFRDPVSGNTWVTITGTAPNQVVTIGNTAVLTLAFTTKAAGGTITFDNNVAIGGTAPQRILHTMRSDATVYTAGIANTAEAWVDNTRTTNGNFSSLAFATRDSIGANTYSSRIAGIHQNHTSGAVAGELAFTCVFESTESEIMRMTAKAVGIGTAAPLDCAILELRSEERGFLPPRMNTDQRNTIPSLEEGLIVYDTEKRKLYLYAGAAWEEIQSI